MFAANIIFALLAALIFSMLIAGVAGWRHPARPGDSMAGAMVFVFFVLFLTSWVGGVWFRPFGPAIWGTSWVPFFLAALLVGLILLAVAAPPRRSGYRGPERDSSTEQDVPSASNIVFGGFFWLLVVFLLVAIVAGSL